MSGTDLYRHFDKAGALLYIGISLSTPKRLAQHRDHSGWYPDISNITIEQFKTRESALTAERNAIQIEKPKHNIAHNHPPAPKSEKVKQAEEAKADLIRSVTFRPLYTLSEIGRILNMSDQKVREMVKSNEMGAVIMGYRNHTYKGEPRQIVKYQITGWQLIEYIESLEKTIGEAGL